MFKIGNKIIKLPIIQGGMAVGVSLDKLSSAVSNQGGVGVIGTAGIGLMITEGISNSNKDCIEGLKHYINKAKQKTNGILGVNIMVALSNYSDMVKTAIEEKADVIFSGAGLPLNLPSFLKRDSITKLIPIVSSLKAAKLIFKKWVNKYNYIPDGFVFEGPDAGGHLGFKKELINNFDLFNEIKLLNDFKIDIKINYKKEVPLIVGGGIFNKTQTYKLFNYGVDAIQVGTPFIATEECDASPSFKKKIVDAKETDIKIIDSPVGMPGRALNNKFIKEVYEGKFKPKSCFYKCIKSCDINNALYCIATALYNSVIGNVDDGLLFIGKNGHMINEISNVKKVINKII